MYLAVMADERGGVSGDQILTRKVCRNGGCDRCDDICSFVTETSKRCSQAVCRLVVLFS